LLSSSLVFLTVELERKWGAEERVSLDFSSENW
jgi:hypothetical protein